VKRLFPNTSKSAATLTGATGHMHNLGTEIKAVLVRANGERECLLDIRDWDFSWQQSYRFLPGADVTVQPGDALELTCVYDNSLANQPVINGVQQAPRDVKWGEGTTDEMCLLYGSFTAGYATKDPTVLACANSTACFAGASGHLDASDILNCEDASWECSQCVLTKSAPCLIPCQDTFAALKPCLTQCGVSSISFGGAPGKCLDTFCPDEYAALLACVDPIIASGRCDASIEQCGLDMTP